MRRHILALALLAGCSPVLPAPDAQQPVAPSYATPVPQAQAALDMDWWSQTGDAQLTALLAQAHAANPDLRMAAAQVMAARARAGQDAAGLWPSVSGQAAVTANDTAQTRSAALDASWEIDLFRKTLHAAEAERLRADAEATAYAGAYVSLSAEVADLYLQYRACRLTEHVYRDAVTSQTDTTDATSGLATAGLRAGSDLALARAGQASARISATSQAAECRVLALSLGSLTGAPQDQVDAILAKGGDLPRTRAFRVSTVPADILRQRPDIAEAEAKFAASLLDLGVAQADLYPALSLNGSLTLTGEKGWSFGPALSIPILDGGQRRAAVRVADADAIVAAETYRGKVLSAVAEAETALTRLNTARANLAQAGTLVAEYDTYFAAVDTDWQAGRVSLLDREEARRQVQSARISQISQRLLEARQWIALYKALGGGWQRPETLQTTKPNGA